MNTISERIKFFAKTRGYTIKDMAEKMEVPYNNLRVAMQRQSLKNEYIEKLVDTFGISRNWIVTGEGEMEIEMYDGYTVDEDVNILRVQEPYVMDVFENKNSNKFMKMPNGQYFMTMPMADFHIQAGFLDQYQDLLALSEMPRHGIVVDKPVKGRYVAFRVKGDSMDDGTSNAIQHDSIVATRELQRHLWTSKIRFNNFPYWVIYTSASRTPLLKEITDHNIETGVITCHSLNDGPGYADFDLNLDDVQALFYVIRVNKDVGAGINYM